MGAQYLCYHGDPAFRLNTRLRPDYFISEPLVSHSPNPVSTQMSTFDLNIDIYNLGEAIDTVFYIEINREFPNGQTDFVSRQQINAPYFNQRVTVEVPVGGQQALGINFFEIKIDSDEEVAESPNPAAEQNNIVIRYPVQIISDAIIPVYPTEFAIVPEQPITLKASTGNTFANIQNYRIQIDTTEYFNSPLFRETTVSQAGGLVEWTPSVTYLDSVVYYWRVSATNTAGTSAWSATRSFTTVAPLALPDAPALSAPANNATNQLTATRLSWGAAARATTYEVQVSLVNTFATTAFSRNGLTARNVTISPALTARTIYYWRVRAVNATGAGAWSATQQYTTR
jgi:hypothetical protein